MTPTARSLKLLRERGYLAEKVEQRLPIPGKFITRDLFNCIDVIAVHPERKEILGIQATSGSNVSARITKTLEQAGFDAWRRAGGLFVIHGWAKQGPRGKRKLWTCREVDLSGTGYVENPAQNKA